MERYHTFCEYYMYKTLSEHTFYVVDNNIPFIGRPLPENAKIISWKDIDWKIIDCGYAVSVNRFVDVLSKNKPCVFHIDQVPQEWDNPKKLNNIIGNKTPVVYWSKEEAEMWSVGEKIVRPHPIDSNLFKGYDPNKNMAITIATRAISGWGPSLKGFNVLKIAYNELPIQVIAKGDRDFDNAKEILSEEEMIKTLQNHNVYFNSAWKIDRSPLEAMSVGMPVVAIRTKYNVYLDIFENNKSIFYANNTSQMIEITKMLLNDKKLAKNTGNFARETIKKHFNPELSKEGWNVAFNHAIKNI